MGVALKMVNCYVWSRGLFVALGGAMLGFDIGSLNGVKDMVGYRKDLSLSYLNTTFNGINDSCNSQSCNFQDDAETSAILGLIVSLFFICGLAGALMAGFISDLAGRKPAVILGASLVASGALLHAAAVHLGMALAGRVIGGIGLGVLYQVTPLYMAEMAPEDLRGRLLSFITIYGACAYLLGTVLNIAVKDTCFGWRISLGVPSVAGTLLAVGMVFFPRSPRWLVKRHREEEALQVLVRIYGDEKRAGEQLLEIKSTLSETEESLSQTLKYICTWKNIQRILLGFLILFLGRVVGVNFITYFSVSVFCSIGLPGFVASLAIAVVNIIFIALSLFVIDKIGRKPLLLIGAFIIFVCFIVAAALIFRFDLENSVMEGLTLSQRVAGYFMMIIVSLLVGMHTMSFGSIPWVIMGELFPLRGRSLMISISNTGFWIGFVVINQIGPVLVSTPLRVSGTTLLFAGINLFVFVFILLMLPETKGRTLEKIEELFSKPWLERVNVLYYLRCGCVLDSVSKKKKLCLDGNKYRHSGIFHVKNNTTKSLSYIFS